MNEQRWKMASEPEQMLQFLRIQPLLSVALVDRKLMYWMAAALRKFSDNVLGADLIEAFANGELSVKQLRRHEYFHTIPSSISLRLHSNVPLAALQWTQEQSRTYQGVRGSWDHRRREWVEGTEDSDEWAPRRDWLVALLRELFGNPWAVPDPTWRYYHDGLVRRLVEEIELDAAWDLMPILGDALEDAGCTEQDVLDHCRADVPHRKGCWVLDLIRMRT